MKPQYKTLSAIEFNRAVKYLKNQRSRLTEKSLDLARKVLVEDIPASTLARQYDCTAQLITRVASKIYTAYLNSQELPSDWVSIRVELPRNEANRVKALEKQLKAALKNRRNLPT